MAYLIVNAQVWDGENDERYPAEVLIEHNRITAVARGQGQIRRDGAEIIDGGGMTLMPGMVEGHCHLSFVGPARNQDLGEIPPEEHLLRTCRNATLILNHGFTSCYSAASAKLRLDVVVRQEIEDGHLAGPRYRAAGPEITVTGGLGDERKQHMHAESFGMIADGPDEIRRAVRLCCREGVDNVKINISGDEFVSYARAEVTSMSEVEVATAVEVAHEWNKRVACHSRAAASVKRAVRNHVDCIYHCDFADEEALDMLEAAKDRVIVGPAFGLVHNAVFEGEAVGMTREVVESMHLPRKLEATCRTYEQMRKRGMKVVDRRRLRLQDHADGPERARHRPFRQVLRLFARGGVALRDRGRRRIDGSQGRTRRDQAGRAGGHAACRRQSAGRSVGAGRARSAGDDHEGWQAAPRSARPARGTGAHRGGVGSV